MRCAASDAGDLFSSWLVRISIARLVHDATANCQGKRNVIDRRASEAGINIVCLQETHNFVPASTRMMTSSHAERVMVAIHSSFVQRLTVASMNATVTLVSELPQARRRTRSQSRLVETVSFEVVGAPAMTHSST